SIYRAVAESMASENAGRLASMERAEKNIQERIEELILKYNQCRQLSITEELLDIVAGYEALTS
ncbi:MAG: F0F1 ATP synthase subunit gamma, partial [Desulfomonilaceae bacterium]